MTMQPLSPEAIAELKAEATQQRAELNPVPASLEGQEEGQGTAPEVQEAPKPSDALKAVPGEPFDVVLNNGKKVVLQKPVKPIALHVAMLLGRDSMNPALELYFRALMWVKSINGMNLPFLATREACSSVHEMLGDDGLEQITASVMLAERAEAAVDLDAVKK